MSTSWVTDLHICLVKEVSLCSVSHLGSCFSTSGLLFAHSPSSHLELSVALVSGRIPILLPWKRSSPLISRRGGGPSSFPPPPAASPISDLPNAEEYCNRHLPEPSGNTEERQKARSRELLRVKEYCGRELLLSHYQSQDEPHAGAHSFRLIK